jgi:hypothetical protein
MALIFGPSIVITPIYKDELIGFAKITRDLTKRKELERLTQANIILEQPTKNWNDLPPLPAMT